MSYNSSVVVPQRHIDSPKNPHLKALLRLRERRIREREGRFLVEGAREVGRALSASPRILEALLCPERFTPEAKKVAVAVTAANCGVLYWVSKEAFDRLSLRQRPDGIAVVLPTWAWSRKLANLETRDDTLLLILHGLEKPGNIGALLRTADAVGASAVVLTGGGTDLFNPNVVRASTGSLFTTKTLHATPDEARAYVQRTGLGLIAATPEAPMAHWEADYGGPTAIVLGSEDEGLDSQWLDAAPIRIHIPMLGTADSLNVATAGAVLLYEALRQRTKIARHTFQPR